MNADASAEISDAVWDEAIAGHAGVGSTGAALAAAGGSGDPWATALPGAYGAGTAGKLIGDNINAPIATVDTVVDGIATTLGVAGAGLTALGDARLANLDGAVSGVPTAVENADALLARDIGSGTGAGSSQERTVRSALRVLRNKFAIVGTTRTVYKEDDTNAAFTSTLTTDAAGVPITGDDPT